MDPDDKIANLILFSALLLVRTGKASADSALRRTPLSGRARRLAELIATVRRNQPHESPQHLQMEAQNQSTDGEKNPQSASTQLKEVHPRFGSLHIAAAGAADEIHLTSARLRCPVCWNERPFELDTWQWDRLRIRGYLELYCGHCGTNSLWERSEAAGIPAPRLVL
jgi:hypothetical protein